MNLNERIEEIRCQFGSKLLILGHHYQKEEVIRHTDLRGDSYQLSEAAAKRTDCETIVFCGVHFMVETADILANRPLQVAARHGRRIDVILPDLSAGCDMAEMASIAQVGQCWTELAGIVDETDIVPITYVNSTAELKAFCGRNGGIACTSSNASAVLQWALKRKGRILFFPDQHLGRNTACRLGINEKYMPTWNPKLPCGGLSDQEIKESKIILWDGNCYVHQRFTSEQINVVRQEFPKIRVIVHLECRKEVVDQADEAGSTKLILEKITDSPPGSQWAVGTEANMVNRLIAMFPDKMIRHLSPKPSFCDTMGRISIENLVWSLECLVAGNAQNIIRVPDPIATDALFCLERMLMTKC